MTRIYLIAVSVFGLAIAAIAPGHAPAVEQPAPATERCEAADEPPALVAASTLPNNVCPPPKTCCGWKDPGHHICNRCC